MKTMFNVKHMNVLLGTLISVLVSVYAVAAQVEQAYTTAYRYNLQGQVTGVISPDPDGSGSLRLLATRNTYSNGLLVTVEKGELANWADETVKVAAWTGFTIHSRQVIGYDTYGRKASTHQYDKNGVLLSLTEYSYDDQSRLKCTALRMSLVANSDACSSAYTTGSTADRITRLTYNDYNQVEKEERAVGTSIAQTYVRNVYGTSSHRLDSQYDANGNRTDYYYHETTARLKRVVYPSPTSAGSTNGTENGTTGDYVEFAYDANGNKTSERKRNGTTINYTLDNNDRVTFKDYSNASMRDITYTYDLRSLQLSAKFNSAGGIGITNTYDGFGNLASTSNSMFDNPRLLKYTYDLNNNRTGITHPDNLTFRYTFDGLNRFNALADNSVNTVLSITYQENGRRKNMARYNGASTQYAYDDGVQLNSFSQTFSSSPANNLTNSFTFNAARQITSLTHSNTQYYYQGNDNRTGDYVADGLNRYKSAGGQILGYDGNSNLTFDGMTYYTYDDENRLVSMFRLDDSSFNTTLSYDPNGRLFQITQNGSWTKFLSDGDALVAEWRPETGGDINRRYVHGDQVDEPLVQYAGASTATTNRTYLHADHQGSIIAQSNSAGAVVNSLAYDTYGIPASGNVERFGYTGQLWFKSLGLNYYKARMYSPVLGRFLQTDPIGYDDNMNMYAYTGNDPINKIDPSGMNDIPTYLQGMSEEELKQALQEEKSKPKDKRDSKRIKDIEKAQKYIGARNVQKRQSVYGKKAPTSRGALIVIAVEYIYSSIASDGDDSNKKGTVTIEEVPEPKNEGRPTEPSPESEGNPNNEGNGDSTPSCEDNNTCGEKK